MKKTLLGIVVAAAAFLFGIFAESAVRFGQSLFQKVEVPAHAETGEAFLPIYSEPTDNIYPESTDALGNYNGEIYVDEAEEYVPTPGGYYYSVSEAKKHETGQGTYIYLDVYYENGKQIASATVYEGAAYENETWHAHSAVEVTPKVFRLRTKKVKGVEYRFEGRFLKNGFREEFKYGEKVLKGTLQKFVGGKKVKEIKSDFIHEYDGC